jgi:toxin ParE1/3/4
MRKPSGAATGRRASSFETSFVVSRIDRHCGHCSSTERPRPPGRSQMSATSPSCVHEPIRRTEGVTRRTARLRARAVADVGDAIDHLRGTASDAVALPFIDALEQGINLVTRSPHAGSLKFAYELGIPDLRAWVLKRSPYVIFYVPHDDHIDIWRVLHTRRDLPGAINSDD